MTAAAQRLAARRRRQRRQPRRAVAAAGAEGLSRAVAAGGAEALAMAAAEPFDLVLLDVEMPAISGFEVLSRLRATPLPDAAAGHHGHRAERTARTSSKRSAWAPTTTSPSRSTFRWRSRGSPRTSSHKRAVEDLRESEERYALALQGANDGLWDWNLITNEVYWSPRWKAMLGYDESDIGTSPDEWLTRVHRDDAGRVQGRARRRIWPAAADITRASTGSCTATARSAGCCAAARRCGTPTAPRRGWPARSPTSPTPRCPTR